MADLTTCLTGVWIHSHEEDTPEATVYRRPGYAFPPARGRRGFELREGGEASLIGIAPADGSRHLTSRWTLEERVVMIVPEQAAIEPRRMEIVSCDADRLQVKR